MDVVVVSSSLNSTVRVRREGESGRCGTDPFAIS